MNLEHLSYNAIASALDGDYGRIKKIADTYNNFKEAWDGLAKNYPKLNTEDLWTELKKEDVHLILKDDAEFPARLKEIPYPPFGLYVRGDLTALAKNSLAIVGTTKATPLGKSLAQKFAAELAKENLAISSGLALGIDAAAHTGAVVAGGVNIAVLACGLKNIYPPANQGLADKILKIGGAIISEYPINSPAYPGRFIERNRIISGLSMGTLVIEAPKKSGALATVRFAIEQNRNVYVVPGAVNNLNYAGSHELIKSGAMLVTETADVLKDLNIEPKQLALSVNEKIPELSPEENVIFKTLMSEGEPLTVDKIVELSNYEPYMVNKNLTFLLLKDIIKESGGRYEPS